MTKKLEYKIDIPLFTDEATAIWKDMPNIIQGVVARRQEAIDKFNELDTLMNGGQLTKIGNAFGKTVYTRLDGRDPDRAMYDIKRLKALFGGFISSQSEEIIVDGKRYTILLKEVL